MGERLVPIPQTKGNNIQRLRLIGLLLTAAGIVGQCILFNKLLGAPADGDALTAIWDSDSTIGIAIIVTSLLSTCAVPLFAFLLVEGAKHTSCYWKYFLRVFGLAIVSEIPFDLAMSNKVFDWSSQNPVFGLLVGMVMIYFFKYYSGKSFKAIALAVLVVFMSFLWAGMLRVDEGQPMILIIAALWFSRGKKGIQTLVGCIVTCLCSTLKVDNITYFAAPMMFLMIHFYNEEPGEGNKIINYAAYPVLLMGIWLIAKYAI